LRYAIETETIFTPMVFESRLAWGGRSVVRLLQSVRRARRTRLFGGVVPVGSDAKEHSTSRIVGGEPYHGGLAGAFHRSDRVLWVQHSYRPGPL